MPRRKSIYRRLTPKHRTLGGFTQLWSGPDHIMLVRSTRFVEEYQRFALADIQSIAVTTLPDRIVLQTAAAIGAMAWIALILTVDSTFAKGFFLITGLVALVAIGLDVNRGARCRCYLYTAVSRELLEPVSRVGSATAFLAELRPQIEAAQGGPLEPSQAVEPPRETSTVEQPPVVPKSPGYLPETLFGLFLVNALLILMDLRFPRTEAGSVLITTVFVEVVIAILALFRRGNRDARQGAYIVILLALVCIGWDFSVLAKSVVGWFQLIAEAARRQQRTQPPFVWNSSHNAALFAYAWRFAAAVIGLGTAFYERRKLGRTA